MAISYPRDLPTVTGISSITLRAVNQTAMTSSPFTYKQQIHNHSGQCWEAEVQLPVMKYEKAEEWTAWLLSLNGRAGTFLMGDPNRATPRGSASSAPGSPAINGASQTGSSIAIDGLPASATGYLKAGDYVQFGSASTATLHKVLTQIDTNASGQATLDIWPNVVSASADGSTVVVTNARGRWRLNSGQQDWSIDNSSLYGITFAAVQVIP
jgi:hypothetical protein